MAKASGILKTGLPGGWIRDLSDKGESEARAAGELLRNEGFVFDAAWTSLLKRAIRTLWFVLHATDQCWIPVTRAWQLNERHYGALQGLNKAETAALHGEEQVHIWRRSFDTPPPPVSHDDPMWPGNDPRYADIPRDNLPTGECLKDTVDRVIPYWNEVLRPRIAAGQRLIIAAHGNSLRALVKHLDSISDNDITSLNIPTGVPMVYEFCKTIPEIVDVIEIAGYDFISGISQINSGFMVTILKPWDERTGPGQSAADISAKLNRELAVIPDAQIFAVNPPAIQGLGSVGGFAIQIQDLNNLGVDALSEAAMKVVFAVNKQPFLSKVYTTFRNDVPQLWLDIDREMAEASNVDVGSIFTSLQAALGSYYINDFNRFGRVYQVMIQADAEYRMQPEDALKVRIPTRDGTMVPLGSFASVSNMTGPNNVPHYNIYDTVPINGSSAPGYSSGTAIKVMERVCDTVLPDGIGYEWTGLTYQEIKAGNLAPFVFALALIAVFLFLAAQYESWTLPYSSSWPSRQGFLGHWATSCCGAIHWMCMPRLGWSC